MRIEITFKMLCLYKNTLVLLFIFLFGKSLLSEILSNPEGNIECACSTIVEGTHSSLQGLVEEDGAGAVVDEEG